MNKPLFLIALSLVVILQACIGSNSSSNSDNGGEAETMLTGRFIDAPVQGLKYSTPSRTGYTSALGKFAYKKGEYVTFAIGNLKLGSAVGQEIITPLSLTGESDLDSISTKTANIVRLLQTLDEDPDNKGVIKIPDSLRILDLSSIGGIDFSEFANDSDLKLILSTATNLTGHDYELKSKKSAIADMKKYLNLVNRYDYIGAVVNNVAHSKDYLLTMPKDANILIGASYGNYTIYDTELNYVIHDSYSNKKLSAGSYIVKLSPSRGDRPGNFAVNSPALFDKSIFPAMSAGYYDVTGQKDYILNMPSDANVIISGGYISYSVYDMELNNVKHDSYSNKKLSAGSYFVRLGITQDRAGVAAVNSPALVDQTKLPIMTSGSYDVSHHKYYILNMPSDANVIISGGYISYSVYDMELNNVKHDSYSNKKLSAGSYIVRLGPTMSWSGTATVTSLVL